MLVVERFKMSSRQSAAILPLSGNEIAHTNDQRHKTSQRIAIPETLTPHANAKTKQGSDADAADHAINNGYSEVELCVAGTIDQRETGAAGGRTIEVEDGRCDQYIRHRKNMDVGCEQIKNLLREQQHDNSKGTGNDHAAHGNGPHNQRNAFVFFRTQVLTNHGAAGSSEGIGNNADHHVDLVVNPGKGGEDHAREVDPGGKNNFGQVDCRRLNGHRNAKCHQLFQRPLFNGEAGEF